MWFKGTIVNAISKAKSEKVLFIVYVSNNNHESKEFLNVLNNFNIPNYFKTYGNVAIKIDDPSIEKNQFNQLYPVKNVPVLYFINYDGVLIEFIEGFKNEDFIKNKKHGKKKLDVDNSTYNVPHTNKKKEKEIVEPKNYATTHIQFRLPDGSNFVREYDSSLKFVNVYKDVKELIKDKVNEFQLSTIYPKQILSEDLDKNLKELNLVPKSVLMIIQKNIDESKPFERKSNLRQYYGRDGNFIQSFLKSLMYLKNILFTFISSFIYPPSPVEQKSNLKEDKPTTSQPNIKSPHLTNRLVKKRKSQDSDNRQVDGSFEKVHTLKRDDTESSEDENTWNGNSTQQK